MQLWVPFVGAGGILVSLFVCVVVGKWFIATWNKLVHSEGAVNHSWEQIKVQLKRRHDLIPDIFESTKGIMKHETKFYDKLFDARATAAGASQTNNVLGTANAERAFSQMIPRIQAVSEAYPEIKANEMFMQLSNELSNIEEEIAKYRSEYNDRVGSYNILIRLIPTIFVAKLKGCKTREYYDIFPEEGEDIKIKF